MPDSTDSPSSGLSYLSPIRSRVSSASALVTKVVVVSVFPVAVVPRVGCMEVSLVLLALPRSGGHDSSRHGDELDRRAIGVLCHRACHCGPRHGRKLSHLQGSLELGSGCRLGRVAKEVADVSADLLDGSRDMPVWIGRLLVYDPDVCAASKGCSGTDRQQQRRNCSCENTSLHIHHLHSHPRQETVELSSCLPRNPRVTMNPPLDRMELDWHQEGR